MIQIPDGNQTLVAKTNPQINEEKSMNIPKEINVLGTKYKVDIRTDDEYGEFEDRNAYNDRSSKRIVVEDLTKLKIKHPLDNIAYSMKQSFNHELFHALLHEAGLSQYAHDETLIEALAILMPKIKEYL